MFRPHLCTLALLFITPSFVAAADDDLFSSKPTKPTTPPAQDSSKPFTPGLEAVFGTPTPTREVAKVAEVLPALRAGAISTEEVDALRQRYQQVIPKLKTILDAAANESGRDELLVRLAEVTMAEGEYDLAVSTIDYFQYKSTAIDSVLEPLMTRLAAQGNTVAVAKVLEQANRMAGTMGWTSTQITVAVSNTLFALGLGDREVFRAQYGMLTDAALKQANRDRSEIYGAIEIATDLPMAQRLAPTQAKSFYADVGAIMNLLVVSEPNNGHRAHFAQALFRAGLFDDAIKAAEIGGPAAVALYTDAAKPARVAAGDEFEAALAELTSAYATRDDFDRFVAFGILAHALSAAGRHEDAVRAALVSRTSQQAYDKKQTANAPAPALAAEWKSKNTGWLAPVSHADALWQVIRAAVREDATNAVLAARTKYADGTPASRAIVDHVIDVLIERGKLDEALAVYREHRDGDNDSAQDLANALIRAGRLDDAEKEIFQATQLASTRRRGLWRESLALADAWRVQGQPEKARAALRAVYSETVKPEHDVVMIATGWARLGDTDMVNKLLGAEYHEARTRPAFTLPELQPLADRGDFAALATKIAALPAFAADDANWRQQADHLCDALARAGQWNLLAALSAKTTGIERARPLVAELGAIIHYVRAAANQSAAPAIAGDAKVLLAPYAQWVASVPETERPAEDTNLLYFHGRLGAWDEAFALASAAELLPVRQTQAWLTLCNAARDNRDWARATQCLGKARESLAKVTGADRTGPLLITYCNEALFTRDTSDLGDRFREAAQLINASTKLEDRTNQFSDLALVAVHAGDGPAFNQLGGAAMQSAIAWTKEAPGDGDTASRADYSMIWLARRLMELGHVDAAGHIAENAVAHPAEKEKLRRDIGVARVAQTPDDKMIEVIKQQGDHGDRLKTLLGTYATGGVINLLADAGRTDIVFKLLLLARDYEFATGHEDSFSELNGIMDGTNVASLLESGWPSTVERVAQIYLAAGRNNSAAGLGPLFTTPRAPVAAAADDDEDDWAAADARMFAPRYDYATPQAALAQLLAKAGQAEEARRLLQAIPASTVEAGTDTLRQNIASALLHLGEWARAEAMIKSMKEATPRMLIHAAAVQLAVAKGDAPLAQKHLALARVAAQEDTAKSSWQRDEFVAALALGGDPTAAAKEIEAITGWTKSRAASAPAVAWAKQGQWTQAIAWIAKVPRDLQRDCWLALQTDLIPRPPKPSIKP